MVELTKGQRAELPEEVRHLLDELESWKRAYLNTVRELDGVSDEMSYAEINRLNEHLEFLRGKGVDLYETESGQ